MNEKGNLLFFLFIGLIVIALLPPVIFAIWPPAKLLFQIFSIFMIYSLVRGYLGSGSLTLIVSSVFIWFLVFKYTTIFAALWLFQLLLALSFISVVIWGIGTSLPRGG